MLQIFIDGVLRDLLCQIPDHILQKIVVIEDQRLFIQIVKPLDIIQLRAHGKSGPGGQPGVCRKLCEVQHLCPGGLLIPDGGFFKGFDAADGKGGPERRLENVADTLSLHGLHIAVGDQGADGPAHGVAGTVIGEDQVVFRRQQLLKLIFAGLYFSFQIFVYFRVFCFWHRCISSTCLNI